MEEPFYLFSQIFKSRVSDTSTFVFRYIAYEMSTPKVTTMLQTHKINTTKPRNHNHPKPYHPTSFLYGIFHGNLIVIVDSVCRKNIIKLRSNEHEGTKQSTKER